MSSKIVRLISILCACAALLVLAGCASMSIMPVGISAWQGTRTTIETVSKWAAYEAALEKPAAARVALAFLKQSEIWSVKDLTTLSGLITELSKDPVMAEMVSDLFKIALVYIEPDMTVDGLIGQQGMEIIASMMMGIQHGLELGLKP